MRKNFLLVLLLSLFQVGYAQETLLYNGDGSLKCDPSYVIESNLLKNISNIEKSLIGIYENLEYPILGYENGIQGLVIAKIHIDKENLSIWCEIVKSPDPLFKDPVKKAVYESRLKILRATKNRKSFSFYLPIEFKTTRSPFLNELQDNQRIVVNKHHLYQYSVGPHVTKVEN